MMADAKNTDKKDKKSGAAKDSPALKADSRATAPEKKRRSGISLLAFLIGIAVLAFIIALAGFEYFDKSGGKDKPLLSAPSVGGPSELVNQRGETVTDKDFLGGYMMVFFGYTYCPDVCPTALSDMAAALDMLPPEKAKQVTPVFISVDPNRDTPEHLAEYVGFFHPRTVGLTGTEEQIKAVAREYRVYFRTNDPTGDDPQDYLVDHTSIIYLIGPEGNLVTHFSHGTTAEAMAERIGQLL
jgi:cytochrome oxidase Cu insertion factor (SCO1/SenC/PrrC family)